MAYTYSWTALSWPTSAPIPQKGFTESMGTNILRTPMDAGPAKIRYRGKKPSMLNVTFLMTTAEVAVLETFLYTTTKGITRFGFPHPRTGTVVEVRVVAQSTDSLYSVVYAAPGYWTVTMQLEILP